MSSVDKPRAVLVCPGRGSYGKAELGFVGRAITALGARSPRAGGSSVGHVLDHADAVRRESGRPTIRDLDAAAAFQPSRHLDGENAAELIYFGSVAHAAVLEAHYDICAVAGNSLGWYTALPVCGALTPHDGWRLVTTMARLQRTHADPGGQILTTTLDDDWQVSGDLASGVRAALAHVDRTTGAFAARSIRLGGHEVIAGNEAGLRVLAEHLPKVESDSRSFPFRLGGHGPFHTRLCARVAEAAARELGDLEFHTPATALIDGVGNVHSPWSADPGALLRYTVGSQVTETYDFTASIRTAIREFQPDVLLCVGPGSSLRAPVGHVVLQEHWRGVKDKRTLFDSGLVVLDPIDATAAR